MSGATHPFFGNQYTSGGYIPNSFKFPPGLTREVCNRVADIASNISEELAVSTEINERSFTRRYIIR
jgi:hypothetical protein